MTNTESLVRQKLDQKEPVSRRELEQAFGNNLQDYIRILDEKDYYRISRTEIFIAGREAHYKELDRLIKKNGPIIETS